MQEWRTLRPRFVVSLLWPVISTLIRGELNLRSTQKKAFKVSLSKRRFDLWSAICRTPMRRYLRSGAEMVRMANIYEREDDLERAYVLNLKYLTLFVEKIRGHPEFNYIPPQVHDEPISLKAVLQSGHSVYLQDNTRMVLTLKDVMVKTERIKSLLHQRLVEFV